MKNKGAKMLCKCFDLCINRDVAVSVRLKSMLIEVSINYVSYHLQRGQRMSRLKGHGSKMTNIIPVLCTEEY